MSSVEYWRAVEEWGMRRGEMIGVGRGEDFGLAIAWRDAVLGLVTAWTSMDGSKDPMPWGL